MFVLALVVSIPASVAQAELIDSFVNLDFDSGAVTTGGPGFKGFDAPDATEIIGWSNYPAGPLADAGVEAEAAWWSPYEVNAAFMASGDGAYNMSSYVIQDGDVFQISFMAKEWSADVNGEWTVTLFYDDPANVIGTYVTGNMTNSWTAYTDTAMITATPESVGGTLGILFESTGTSFANLDEVTVERVRLVNNSPADADTLISPVRTNAENDLVFTIYDSVLGGNDVEVYLTARDPNVPDLITTFIAPGTGTQTVTLETELTADLEFDTTYYWKAVGYEPNALTPGILDPVSGPVWSFTTAPEAPYFIDPVPEVVVADENDSVSVTVNAGNTDTYAWYKEGDTPGSAGTTDTLVLTGVTEAEAGNYYCDISFEGGPAVTSDPIKVVARLLIAHWPFDDDLIDATGNGWNGTTMSATTSFEIDPNFLTGFVGQALDLDGTETYVDLPDGLQDDVRSGLTYSVWAYPRTAANWARFLSFNNGADSDNLFFSRVGTGTTLRFNVTQGATGSGVEVANALALNVWQMFTVTMSQTGEVVLYKNGLQIGAGTVLTPNVIARTNNWMGQSAWPDALYNGLLDDIRIYNHALTPEEVALLYTSTTPEVDYICLPDAENPLTYDVNGDCRVNLFDIVDLAGAWLDCDRVNSVTDACLFAD